MRSLTHSELTVYSTPVPWILGICFDCTVSISERDFGVAQDELVGFLLNVHRRALALPGLPSDFVAMTAFKDNDKIFGPSAPLEAVKMDRGGHVGALCNWIKRLERDGGATALYDTIRVAASDVVLIDRRVPGDYLKVVIAITDGEDNDSKSSLDDLDFFRRSDLHLAVIGVGDGSSQELRRLAAYATSVHAIGNFSNLFRALTISMTRVVQRRTRILYR